MAAAAMLTLAAGADAATGTWAAGAGAATPFWDLGPNGLGGLAPNGSGDSAPGGTTAVSGVTTFGNSVNLAFGRVLELDGDANWSGNLGTLSIAGARGSGSSYGASSVNLAAGKTLTVLNSANGQTIGGVGNVNNAGIVVASGTTLSIANVNFKNLGTIDVKASTTVAWPTNFTNPGRLMGSGTFTTGTLTNSGHVAPGESPGTLALVGNLVQGSTSALDIELETPTSFDLLKVSGSTALGGHLNIVCFADCRLAVGQSFKVLDGAAHHRTGTFAGVLLSGFATGAFDVV